jgi:hypothetical protein
MSSHNHNRRNEDPEVRQARLRNQRLSSRSSTRCSTQGQSLLDNRTSQNQGSQWTILGSLKDLDGTHGGDFLFNGAVNQVRANARGMKPKDTYGAIIRPEMPDGSPTGEDCRIFCLLDCRGGEHAYLFFVDEMGTPQVRSGLGYDLLYCAQKLGNMPISRTDLVVASTVSPAQN